MEIKPIDSYFSGYISFLEESGMLHLAEGKVYQNAKMIEITDPGFDIENFRAGEIQAMKECIIDLFKRIHQTKGD